MRKSINKAEIDAFLRSHEPVEEPQLLDIGQFVGDWQLTAFIGRGGSGEVYSAKHTKLSLNAAIKVLLRDDAQAKDRFRREAQLLADNAIPSFPRFLGFGETVGRPYMVLELLDPFPLPSKDREIAQYLLKVCKGVERLHALGLVHRDIKPQNILLRSSTGDPVLIDLGLVKDVTLPPAHRGESLSIVNGKAVGVGTPRYAAPEQFAGGEISPSADIHALGMLANDCFLGKPRGAWVRIVRRSTSSIPSQRYGSISEFARAIRRRHVTNVLRFVVQPLIVCVLVFAGVLFGKHQTVERFLKDRLRDDKSPVATQESPGSASAVDAPAPEKKRVVASAISTNADNQTSSTNKFEMTVVEPVVSNKQQSAAKQKDKLSPPRGKKAELAVGKSVDPATRKEPPSLISAPKSAPVAKPRQFPQSGVFTGDKGVDTAF